MNCVIGQGKQRDFGNVNIRLECVNIRIVDFINVQKFLIEFCNFCIVIGFYFVFFCFVFFLESLSFFSVIEFVKITLNTANIMQNMTVQAVAIL